MIPFRIPFRYSHCRRVWNDRGIREEFDWNLPKLLEFIALYFEGPISIPDLVEILHLEAKSRQVIEEDDFDPYGFEDHSFAPGEYWRGENIGEGW